MQVQSPRLTSKHVRVTQSAPAWQLPATIKQSTSSTHPDKQELRSYVNHWIYLPLKGEPCTFLGPCEWDSSMNLSMNFHNSIDLSALKTAMNLLRVGCQENSLGSWLIAGPSDCCLPSPCLSATLPVVFPKGKAAPWEGYGICLNSCSWIFLTTRDGCRAPTRAMYGQEVK